MNTSLDKRRAALRAISGDHALGPETLARLDALSEEEARQNALSDTDAPLSSSDQLSSAKARHQSSSVRGKNRRLAPAAREAVGPREPASGDVWPTWEFNPGPREHLHAIGVITITYSQLERSVESLFLNFVQSLSVPFALAQEFFLHLAESQKSKVMLQAFREFEKDDRIHDLVENLLACLAWSRDCRNKIAHSEQYPVGLGRDESLYYFQKRAGKKNIEPLYFSLDLMQLREIADQMREHVKRSAELDIYLRIRGKEKSQLDRVYWQFLFEKLPEPLVVPSILELHDTPNL